MIEIVMIVISGMFGQQLDFEKGTITPFDHAKISTPISFLVKQNLSKRTKEITSPHYGWCKEIPSTIPNTVHLVCGWDAEKSFSNCSGLGTYLFIKDNGNPSKGGHVLHSQTRACPEKSYLMHDTRAMIGTYTATR